MIAERTYELDRARTETLQLLALAGEYRDDDTAEHTERVAAMAAQLAQRLGLDAQTVEDLREAALLHDVGKIAIPDHILLNPGTLSEEEQEIMRTHAVLGSRLLRGSASPVLQMASVIAASHHEWWDGSGYPAGLAGERIPLVARIVAVADVFDALTHDRPYKPAWPLERAVARIERGAGSQFDPQVVSAFMRMPRQLEGVEVPAVLSRHLAPDESVQRRLHGRRVELVPPRLSRRA
jgi:putative two-component system response regulator